MNVHMIGNAHLDPAWVWRWQDGAQEAIATFQSAVDRIEEYDDFIFTKGEKWAFEQVEKNAPELFEKVKLYVKAGRISIVNGWIVQPDCNLPSGESYIRHALYGQKYFREKFGVVPKVAYNVDSFGHHANLPQILSKCGYEMYVITRPLAQEWEGVKKQIDLPATTFRWKSPDGSEILTYHITCWEDGSYGVYLDNLQKHIEATIKTTTPELNDAMCFFGVGNHGGGPTIKQIEYIIKNKNYSGGVELKCSSTGHYLQAIIDKKGDLPIVQHELNRLFSGCYSSCSMVKKRNREAENLLIRTERLAAIATEFIGNIDYPFEKLEHAWENLLFNQFHDILCGCGIRGIYDDALNAYGAIT
ncbi:MAG: hypothetical protein KAS17_02735, partial [Victivallaceae bacterium]|nr:hypothetical protein [Victivallaceae bacterium]